MEEIQSFEAVECYANFVAAFSKLFGEDFLVDEVVFNDSVLVSVTMRRFRMSQHTELSARLAFLAAALVHAGFPGHEELQEEDLRLASSYRFRHQILGVLLV